MFANATTNAIGFTHPVVISQKLVDGTCASILGSFVVVNDDGWVMTAWHILAEFEKLQASRAALDKYRGEKQLIDGNEKLTPQQRQKALRVLGAPRKDWVEDFSYWFSFPRAQLVDVKAKPKIDIAIGRLDPFDKTWVKQYPTFKDPSKGFPIGTSVCKLGFPFHSITPTHDATGFHLPPEALPIPHFPIDGITTRNIIVEKDPAGYVLGWLETSSAGLRGQSGGPIYDQHGTIWAIQSRTNHYPLGFNPPVPGDRKGTVEHQFLNVGMGVHPETVVGFLRETGVAHQLSNY